MKKKKQKQWTPLLWALTPISLLGLLFSRILWADLTWLSAAFGILALILLIGLIIQNRNALKTRTAAFGINSAITTILVLGIVGVVNFLGFSNPVKFDLTEKKIHTLSDQTQKFLKSLDKEVKATFFAKLNARDKYAPLFNNYKALNTKFQLEYIDPDKEPTRAKTAGIKKYNTLYLVSGERNTRIEEPTEEKLTNAIIKLVKEKKQTLCALTGHGEKDFDANTAAGYSAAKKELEDQAYTIQKLNLPREGKVPPSCDAVAILGPKSAFFENEVQVLSTYLKTGGRALIALDIEVSGKENAPGLIKLLGQWFIEPKAALIVDPLSRMLGVDAAVPIVATYSKSQAITKDFQESSYFPFVRPLEVKKNVPSSLKVEWIAQTTPKSWGEANFKELAQGRVSFNSGTDFKGPLSVALTAEGKIDASAPKKTRLAVFGTSQLGTNNHSRFGVNLDFFLNAVSWVLEDESLISIRTKQEEPGKIELSETQSQMIFWITVVLVPLAIVILGIVVWWRRKKL